MIHLALNLENMSREGDAGGRRKFPSDKIRLFGGRAKLVKIRKFRNSFQSN